MRIVGGRHRGRRLATPEGRDIRPTADRAREALFNLLAHGPYAGDAGPMPTGVDVLDAFAGTGALGFEALSRGAAHVTFLEQDAAAVRLIKENAATLKETAAVTVLQRDATQPGPAPRPHGLALLDAPYRSGLTAPALTALAADGWLAGGAVVVVELGKNEELDVPGGFTPADDRRYGAARMILLRYEPV